MLKIRKRYFIITNFLLNFFIFQIVYYIRYIFFLKEATTVNIQVTIIFLLFSLLSILFSIALKVYEIPKVTTVVETISMLSIADLFAAMTMSLIYYITKIDFPRFVFISGFLLTVFSKALFNRVTYLLLVKKFISPTEVFYIGSFNNLHLINELIENYRMYYRLRFNKKIEIAEEIKQIQQKDSVLLVDTSLPISEDSVKAINDFEDSGGKVVTTVDFFEYLDESLPPEFIERNYLDLFSYSRINSLYEQSFKRSTDIIFSILFIIITLPLIVILFLLVKLTSRGPAIIKQERMGKNDKPFIMYKFRSMVVDAEKNGVQLAVKNDPRVTGLGKFMRPFRLDEILQFFNILKGDMSFVGPRPERPELVQEFVKEIPFYKKRLLVRPGLTGWAQVKHEYASNHEQMKKKLAHDLYYIRHLTFMMDIKIILYTIETIIFHRGAI